MSLRKSVLLLAAAFAALSTASAHAQFGVYGMFTADRLSNIKSSPYATTYCPPAQNLTCPTLSTDIPSAEQSSDSVNPLGGTAGVYYDWRKFGPVRLGFDARGSILTTKRGAYTYSNGPGARIYSGLGGVRAGFHTRWVPVKPYIQGSLGWARSDYGLYTNTVPGSTSPNPLHNNFAWELLGGVDLKLLPIMDWRVVELGYGGLDSFGTYSHNYPVKQISTGIVFHLP